MKTRKMAALFLMLACLLLPVRIPEARAAGIHWRSVEEGMAAGKKENKKVLLYFWAEWCSYCVKMERETLSDGAVVSFLGRHFIAVKVDTDRDRKSAERYGVRGLPTLWFVSEEGEKIGNRTGFVDPKTFVHILEYMQTDSYKRMSLNKFLKEKS